MILTNTGALNPWRQLADVRVINTQTWLGVTSQGVTAEWTAEAAEATIASPTFAQPSITPIRADCSRPGLLRAGDGHQHRHRPGHDLRRRQGPARGDGICQRDGLNAADRGSDDVAGDDRLEGQRATRTGRSARSTCSPSTPRCRPATGRTPHGCSSPFVWNAVRQMGNTPSPYRPRLSGSTSPATSPRNCSATPSTSPAT